jgi:tetratricopeptide (TPR) repeat protein
MKHLSLTITFLLGLQIIICQSMAVSQDDYESGYQNALLNAHNDPHNPAHLLSIGFMLKKLNRYEQALALYEYARPYVSQKSSLERALSGAYLAIGDFEHGWPAYEYRWTNPPAYNQELKNYLERGGSLHNKIVVLKTEYGLGDTLQFIRYAQILKDAGAYVIVESQKSLIPLLTLCPYIDKVCPQESVNGAHFFALLMSLPLILHTNVQTIPAQVPYLFADPELVSRWSSKKALHKKLHIGICWQADIHAQSHNQTVIDDAKSKSIALNYFFDLAQLDQIQLYSLQKVNGLEQLKSCDTIIHFDDLDTTHGPFMDTAALMKNLDLVITIDTSIAHLAGGLGVPCWLLLNYGADWRWLGGMPEYQEISPFYPTMKLFRQKTPGDWRTVIREVTTKLKEMAQE